MTSRVGQKEKCSLINEEKEGDFRAGFGARRDSEEWRSALKNCDSEVGPFCLWARGYYLRLDAPCRRQVKLC